MEFDKDCTTELADTLIRLYAEYVEGNIESSKDQYNTLITTATKEDLMYIIYKTPFERQAVQISKAFNTEILPEPVRLKLEIDNQWLEKLKRYIV
jgi:hypothetical protein